MKIHIAFLCSITLVFAFYGLAKAVPVPVYLDYYGFIVDDDNIDDSVGNSDGIINPGEIIELYAQVELIGYANLTNVQGTITTGSPYLTPLQNTSSMYSPDPMSPGDVGINIDDFEWAVDTGTPIGTALDFAVSWTASEFPGSFIGQFSIDVEDAQSAAVPEPSTLLLIGTGLVGFIGFRKKFKKS